jgi:pimeloyl-ACP methyl ester carboxylesterase
VIAYCHELNGDRWNVLPYVDGLRRAGFDVFTFDFRNHGGSDRVPGYEPTPWVTTHEVADVRGVVEYLQARSGAGARGVGLLGVGKGAAAALCAAAEEPRVRALVVDGICSVEEFQVPTHRLLRKPSPRFLRWLVRLLDVPVDLAAAWGRLVVGWWRGCRFVCVEQAARRVRQPLLVIHGECDSEVPIEVAEQLLDCMAADVEFWSVPRARHNGAIDVAPAEYQERVSQFFREHLADKPVAEAAPAPARVDRPTVPAAGEAPMVVPVG